MYLLLSQAAPFLNSANVCKVNKKNQTRIKLLRLAIQKQLVVVDQL